MARRPRTPRRTRPPRVDLLLLLLGYLACQAGAGTFGLVSAVAAFARGEVTAGPAVLSAAASLVVLVVSSLLLRLGVRRWVRAQPPDPPAAVGAPSR